MSHFHLAGIHYAKTMQSKPIIKLNEQITKIASHLKKLFYKMFVYFIYCKFSYLNDYEICFLNLKFMASKISVVICRFCFFFFLFIQMLIS